MGRRRKLTDAEIEEVKAWKMQGRTIAQICSHFQISPPTLYKYLARGRVQSGHISTDTTPNVFGGTVGQGSVSRGVEVPCRQEALDDEENC